MAEKIHRVKENFWLFECPGCGCCHKIEFPTWQFNGDLEKPTVRPSILVTGGEKGIRCHSFVTDGKIQFLDDCTHALKNQTVEIPDWNS